jgi:hypothetical protein
MTHASHFYNAMPVVYKEHEFKVPGTVESVYALQDMTVEVIADGIQVPLPLDGANPFNHNDVERQSLTRLLSNIY